METKFDVIIFGATGCVGKCVVLEAVHVLEGHTWAIAGRSRCKLEYVLEKTFQQTGIDVRHTSILIADANDAQSIEYIAQQCKVLVNCCGPYQLWSELIINICLLQRTHYVDMCNDPYFNELMELRYQDRAAESNVYIVSACGFQGFLIDMGVNLLKQSFHGTVNHVDGYVRYSFEHGSCFRSCALFSYSTWLNLIWSCALASELPWLREELRGPHLTLRGTKKPRKELFHKSNNSYNDKAVFLRFPFVDQQLMERTQYQLYRTEKERPIGFYKYMEFPSFLWALLFLIWFLVISFLAKFYVTRNFLLLYPKLFSFGICCSNGHYSQQYANQFCRYNIILDAEGWSNSLAMSMLRSKTLATSVPPNQYMSLELSGYNPIYGCGCLCLLLSARCLLEEKDTMPARGGVFSPGHAFRKADILDKLQLHPYYLSLRFMQ